MTPMTPMTDPRKRRLDTFFADIERRPEIVEEFVREAHRAIREMRAAGVPLHDSALRLLHQVRHYCRIRKGTLTEFKIPNDYSPLLARLLARDDPRFRTVFEWRRCEMAPLARHVFTWLPECDLADAEHPDAFGAASAGEAQAGGTP